jgi:hypothetical protein
MSVAPQFDGIHNFGVNCKCDSTAYTGQYEVTQEDMTHILENNGQMKTAVDKNLKPFGVTAGAPLRQDYPFQDLCD